MDQERAASHSDTNRSDLKPWLLGTLSISEDYAFPETEPEQDRRNAWSQRLPLLLVGLSLAITLTGLFLDRQDIAYLAVGKHVPGTITDHRPIYTYDTDPFPYGGPYSINYTFATESGQDIQGRSNYYAPQVTDEQHRFSVQYLSTNPHTNRPFGQMDWSALYLALAFDIAVALIAFLTFLGRAW